MSGNFVERGYPAIFDKFKRTESALLSGADLVIELPVYYALSSAEHFALAGVSILDSFADIIFFGSEEKNLDVLREISDILLKQPPEYISRLKENLKQGVPFALARNNALRDYEYILKQPNNILAIEYLKAITAIKSKLEPVNLQRIKTGYHSLETVDNFASATLLRKILLKGGDTLAFMPNLPNQTPVGIENFDKAVVSVLRRIEDFRIFPEVIEGLENRIKKAVNNFDTFEEIVDFIKTKRYARTKINRILFNAFLGFDRPYFKENPKFIRILGFNKKGQDVIKIIKKRSNLQIITKPADYKDMLKQDILASDLYYLNAGIDLKELKTKPIIYA